MNIDAKALAEIVSEISAEEAKAAAVRTEAAVIMVGLLKSDHAGADDVQAFALVKTALDDIIARAAEAFGRSETELLLVSKPDNLATGAYARLKTFMEHNAGNRAVQEARDRQALIEAGAIDHAKPAQLLDQ